MKLRRTCNLLSPLTPGLLVSCQSQGADAVRVAANQVMLAQEVNEASPASVQMNVLLNKYSSLKITPTWIGTNARRRDDAALTAAFKEIRAEEGYKAFVAALVTADKAVNVLLDEDILDWAKASDKNDLVNETRNAWRHASSYGISPPKLPVGNIEWVEDGLNFNLLVQSDVLGYLSVRSARGQVIGIFGLYLDIRANHLTRHMLESVILAPDQHLNYPWNVIMATDTIFVDDIWIELDRVMGTVLVGERFGDKTVRGATGASE